jgi:hypothetical protein
MNQGLVAPVLAFGIKFQPSGIQDLADNSPYSG